MGRGRSTVFDLEIATIREALSQTPETLLRNSEGLVVIDEVQRLPALFQVLRPVCDDPNQEGRLSAARQCLLGSDPRHIRDAGRADSIRGCGGLLVGRGGAGVPGSGSGYAVAFRRAWLARSAAGMEAVGCSRSRVRF